jgi:hypothetical protein
VIRREVRRCEQCFRDYVVVTKNQKYCCERCRKTSANKREYHKVGPNGEHSRIWYRNHKESPRHGKLWRALMKARGRCPKCGGRRDMPPLLVCSRCRQIKVEYK